MQKSLLTGILLASILFLSACASSVKESASTVLIHLEAATEIVNPF
jgi:predicted component of type VI protein secretion system